MAMKKETMDVLREAVVSRFGRSVISPVDFKALSAAVEKSVRASMSASTLMRVWGYISTDSMPSRTTLNVLARYAGHVDFKAFEASLVNSPSDDVVSPCISVRDDLAVRDRVRLTWEPGRVCMMRYLGDEQFVVEEATATKLRAGDTFACALIVEGERLYLDNLVRRGSEPTVYVCGKRGGVKFKVIKAQQNEKAP